MKKYVSNVRLLVIGTLFSTAMLGSCQNDSYGHDKDALHEKGDEDLKERQDTMHRDNTLDTADLHNR